MQRFKPGDSSSVKLITSLNQFARYPIAKLIQAIRSAWLLRSSGNLKEAIRLMVPTACPPLLAPLLLKYMDEPLAIPSKRTIARGRINLDLSFELSMRLTFCPRGLPCPKYWVWDDSSPMGGNNWLLVHLHCSQCTSESNWRELIRGLSRIMPSH